MVGDTAVNSTNPTSLRSAASTPPPPYRLPCHADFRTLSADDGEFTNTAPRSSGGRRSIVTTIAYASIIMLPVFVLTLAAQRHIVTGMTMGSVK
ncbi:hypothetical protein [Micromonospora craniellae]|uniref:hypothetical protein n=1 Tax=Micromonospora craniellae TaxID=2294034 RepID=UPI0011C0DBC4|nr:hypothetical protein [Micromonospora craniellae]QOC92258.1 hypothetical protein ID554_00100 [Micromonospora craniellae]